LFDELNAKGASLLVIITGLVGIVVGVIIWYITSRWVAASIFWVEHRYPQMIGTRALRVSEAVVCGLQVFASLALAFWLAYWMIG
jgi:hypothetical protein